MAVAWRLTPALFLLALGTLEASGTEVRTYRCRLTLNVESLFPDKADAKSVTDDFYKGTYNNPDVKKRIQETLALRGKPVTLSMDLVEQTDGQSYYIQLPGVKLPDKSPEIRHEVFKDGINYKWFTNVDSTTDIGHVDKGWKNSLMWSPFISSLLGYLPYGIPAQREGLGPKDVCFMEEQLVSLGSPGDGKSVDGQRNFVIRYADSAKTKIDKIICYWNKRTKSPFCEIAFIGSAVAGNRHQFSQMIFTRYDSSRLESRQVFDLKSRTEVSVPVEAEIPVGQLFQDRRLGEDRQLTFAYNGKRFPTEAEVEQAKVESESDVKGRAANRTPIYQFFAGGVFVIIGLALWIRAKRQ